jgi:hypothetical protein
MLPDTTSSSATGTEDYPHDETAEVGTRADTDKPFYVGRMRYDR